MQYQILNVCTSSPFFSGKHETRNRFLKRESFAFPLPSQHHIDYATAIQWIAIGFQTCHRGTTIIPLRGHLCRSTGRIGTSPVEHGKKWWQNHPSVFFWSFKNRCFTCFEETYCHCYVCSSRLKVGYTCEN